MTKKEAKAQIAAKRKQYKAELAAVEAAEKKHGAAYGALSRVHKRKRLGALLASLDAKEAKLDAPKG